MPTYEYRCTECKNQYETREGFDAPATQACPRCGGGAKRMLFAPPVVFKGSGFYVTDSRKGESATVSASPTSTNGSEKAAASPAPEPAAAPSAAATDD